MPDASSGRSWNGTRKGWLLVIVLRSDVTLGVPRLSGGRYPQEVRTIRIVSCVTIGRHPRNWFLSFRRSTCIWTAMLVVALAFDTWRTGLCELMRRMAPHRANDNHTASAWGSPGVSTRVSNTDQEGRVAIEGARISE